jgi:3-oxoadipate enol-lactonase
MDAFVEIGAGRIHYRKQGSGAPLLLLHSNGASLYEFDGNMDALADRFTVIAWDMPGHGDSTPIATHMTVEAYSDALDQFLNALGIDSATVAGSSIGAVIAADFAARYPHRVSPRGQRDGGPNIGKWSRPCSRSLNRARMRLRSGW